MQEERGGCDVTHAWTILQQLFSDYYESLISWTLDTFEASTEKQ